MIDAAHLIVTLATIAAVLTAVTIHYEAFIRLSDYLERQPKSGRRPILGMILTLIGVHVLEIWLFALTGWGLLTLEGTGEILAPYPLSFLDHVYLSAVTFTTLGYGDIIPMGPVRFLYGTEALTGFALITWSASLTFLEMQRHWNRKHS